MLAEESLDIEDELIEHLAVPDSAMKIYREQISTELLLKDEKGARVLLPFVTDYIDKYGQAPTAAQIVHEVGGHFYDPKSPVEWVIDQLRKRYERNQAKEVVARLASLAVSDPHEAIRRGLTDLGKIARMVASHDRIMDKGDWERAISIYNKRKLAGNLRGLSFGFEEIDEAVGGMRPGTMSFICGRPKSQKSFFLLKCAAMNMLEGARIHFETMELRDEEMYGRFQCMIAGVSYTKYFKGRLDSSDLEKLHNIGEMLQQVDGEVRFVHAKPEDRGVRQVLERAREWSPDGIVIDQFSFITPTSEAKAKHERDASTVYELKDIITPHFPLYVAAQFNREAASLTEMADLANIGLTDAIGQASDIVFGLYRNGDMAKDKIVEFGTIASRASEEIRGIVSNQVGKNGDLKWLEIIHDE